MQMIIESKKKQFKVQPVPDATKPKGGKILNIRSHSTAPSE
jgi:hypothetical protein